MKVFISSLIVGMENIRAAARAAVIALGHQPIIAENFGARAQSPQVACLQGVRQADVVVLILGERYGAKQPTGLSATHEEYREARDRKPVLAFVQENVERDQDETGFVQEVQAWQSGLFRGGFASANDVGPKITQSLHEWELGNAAGPLQPEQLLRRALSLFEKDRHGQSQRTSLIVALAGGPDQAVLRPSEIEDPAFARALQQSALFGDPSIFTTAQGSHTALHSGKLVLQQEDRFLSLDGQGDVVVKLPLGDERRGLPVIIEEEVKQQLAAGAGFTAQVIDRIDPTQRLSQVVLAVQILGGDYLGWRTRRENEANQRSISIGSGQGDRPPVHLVPAHRGRAALKYELHLLIDNLAVLLRRQWSQSG